MILPLLLAVQDMAPDGPLREDEIVVIGQRLKSISVSIGRDASGRYHCALRGSTGRARLDDRLCRATTACVRKGRRGDAVEACVAQAKPRLLADLRKVRR